MVAAPHPHADHHLPCRIRVAAGLCGNADGLGPPHGILLSPRHHHRSPRQRRSRSPHAVPDAGSHPDHCAGIRVPDPRETFRDANCPRPASHYWNRPRPGRFTLGRPSRSHALSNNDDGSVRRAGPRDVVRSPPRPAGTSGDHRPAARLFSLSLHSSEAPNARGTPRSNVHRRRRRRLHPVSDAPGPHLADRRRRPHLGRRLATRLRRGPAAFPASTPSPSPTPTPTTSAACRQC
jgi:hypothetical protein